MSGLPAARIADTAETSAAEALALLAAMPDAATLTADADALWRLCDAAFQDVRRETASISAMRETRDYRSDEIPTRSVDLVRGEATRRALAAELANASPDALTTAKVDAILAGIAACGTWDANALRPRHAASHVGNVREAESDATLRAIRDACAEYLGMTRDAVTAFAASPDAIIPGDRLSPELQRAILTACYVGDVPAERARKATKKRDASPGIPRSPGAITAEKVGKRRKPADSPPLPRDAFTARQTGTAKRYPRSEAVPAIMVPTFTAIPRGESDAAKRFTHKPASLNVAWIAGEAIPGASPADVERVRRFLARWASFARAHAARTFNAATAVTNMVPYPVVADSPRTIRYSIPARTNGTAEAHAARVQRTRYFAWCAGKPFHAASLLPTSSPIDYILRTRPVRDAAGERVRGNVHRGTWETVRVRVSDPVERDAARYASLRAIGDACSDNPGQIPGTLPTLAPAYDGPHAPVTARTTGAGSARGHAGKHSLTTGTVPACSESDLLAARDERARLGVIAPDASPALHAIPDSADPRYGRGKLAPGTGDGTGARVACPDCPRTYANAATLARHAAKDHPGMTADTRYLAKLAAERATRDAWKLTRPGATFAPYYGPPPNVEAVAIPRT